MEWLGLATVTVLNPAVLIPVAIVAGLIGYAIANEYINDVYKQGIRVGGIQQARKDKIIIEQKLGGAYSVQIRETAKVQI